VTQSKQTTEHIIIKMEKKNKKMAKKVKMIEEKGDNGVQKGGK